MLFGPFLHGLHAVCPMNAALIPSQPSKSNSELTESFPFQSIIASPPAHDMDSSFPDNILILGGGIIGLSTAYYLLTSPHLPAKSTITLIERTAIAHCASSRAAGIIAEH